MRQLTSLDAQFLAIENGRNLGHVSGLSVYDPSTAPDGVLTVERMCAVLTERLHLLPPFRWRLAEVPLGLDHPYWIEDTEFDVEYHVRELALPRPIAHLDAIPGVQDIPGAPALARITRRIRRIGRPARDGGMLEAPRSKAPRTVFNGPVSSHRRVAFGTLSLTTVKDIKNATGTTVNDVVVTICAAALRTWLDDRRELPDAPLVAMI